MVAMTHLTPCLLPWQAPLVSSREWLTCWYCDLSTFDGQQLARLWLFQVGADHWTWDIDFTALDEPSIYSDGLETSPQAAEAVALAALARVLHPETAHN